MTKKEGAKSSGFDAEHDGWISANNKMLDGADELMRMAKSGDQSALEALRGAAAAIAHELAEFPELIEQSNEFPVVLSAGHEKRSEQWKKWKNAPIGKQIGFPHKESGKPAAAHKDSAASFWRDVYFWIVAIRSYAIACKNAGVSPEALFEGGDVEIKVSAELQSNIADLPEFGKASRDKWYEVACQLVECNSGILVPERIRKSWISYKKEHGYASMWKGELKRGFGNAWPVNKSSA